MTQKIKSWKEKVSVFFQNCAKKELETEKETAKQCIIHILIKDKTTQETSNEKDENKTENNKTEKQRQYKDSHKK